MRVESVVLISIGPDWVCGFSVCSVEVCRERGGAGRDRPSTRLWLKLSIDKTLRRVRLQHVLLPA